MRTILVLILFLSVACSYTPDTSVAKQLDQTVIDRLPVMMKAYGVDGMTVVAVSGQETLLSVSYGKTKDGRQFTTDTFCPVYSATKVFTSLTIASLVEEGKFDVNSTLGEQLVDVPDDWKEIPVWRLLNHSSGITMIVNKPVFQELVENPKSGNTDIYNIVRQLPLDFNPGDHSRYRQSGYGIVEMIMADKFDVNWPALVEQHVTAPAKATRTVYGDMHSGDRSVPLLSSAGGFQTTANDMAKIFKTLNRGEIVSLDFLEQWLYDDTHNYDGYSLGSVLVSVDDVRTIGHSGGGRANVRFAPASEVGVMVCTDDTSNNNIMHGVADMLMREIATDEPSLMPVQTLLHQMQGKTAAEITSSYDLAKATSRLSYDFSGAENTLNQIGYNMLDDGKVAQAIKIFRLNAREYPNSANTYDSLGEALLEANNLDESLQNYKKVLELDPDNKNALEMIEKIQSLK